MHLWDTSRYSLHQLDLQDPDSWFMVHMQLCTSSSMLLVTGREYHQTTRLLDPMEGCVNNILWQVTEWVDINRVIPPHWCEGIQILQSSSGTSLLPLALYVTSCHGVSSSLQEFIVRNTSWLTREDYSSTPLPGCSRMPLYILLNSSRVVRWL